MIFSKESICADLKANQYCKMVECSNTFVAAKVFLRSSGE